MYPLMACLRPSGVIGASKTVIGASDLLGSLRNLLGSRTAPRLRNPSSGAYPSDPSGVIGASDRDWCVQDQDLIHWATFENCRCRMKSHHAGGICRMSVAVENDPPLVRSL
jgi:hypothetical protein